MSDAPGKTPPRGRGTRVFLPGDFRRVAEILKRETGIELAENKLPLVHARLIKRVQALKLNGFRDYCDYIEGDDHTSELQKLVSVLTTNVTGFFREAHHFDYLRDHRIPELKERLKSGRTVRVWSAGCSSGEEPYSLAITFLDCFPEIDKYDFRILATDIDEDILAAAVGGIYPESSLSTVSDTQKAEFFEQYDKIPDKWQISPKVRKLVTFRKLNLIGPWPFSGLFDVIMCRNVVIYFGEATKAKVWTRLLAQLNPNGWLITGHSERLNATVEAETEFLFNTTYRPVAGFTR